MSENNETTIGVKRITRDELKIISIRSGKKLYELIDESVDLLKAKYGIRL